MTTNQPADDRQLQSLLAYPREDLGIEYKDWLDLTNEKDRATLAKAAIALSNHGGGYIVLGFRDHPGPVEPIPRPSDIPEITADSVGQAINKYCDPEFQCQLHNVQLTGANDKYPIIVVPSSDVPVLCKRNQEDAEVAQYRVYVRKPQPRSEEPHTAEEWRKLLDRCVRARREDMLDAIRAIVLGHSEMQPPEINVIKALEDFSREGHERWQHLISREEPNSPVRFLHGYFELAFSLIGAVPAESLTALKRSLAHAHQLNLSGWPLFLDLKGVPELEAHIEGNYIETWLGGRREQRPEPSRCCFWRASRNGELYTIMGYTEDDPQTSNGNPPSTIFYGDLPIVRMSEGLLFASKLAEAFNGTTGIAVQYRFVGLQDRQLVWLDRIRYGIGYSGFICRDSSPLARRGQGTLGQIRDNLPEFVLDLLRPLYEQFNFYELTLDRVRQMLTITRGFGSYV